MNNIKTVIKLEDMDVRIHVDTWTTWFRIAGVWFRWNLEFWPEELEIVKLGWARGDVAMLIRAYNGSTIREISLTSVENVSIDTFLSFTMRVNLIRSAERSRKVHAMHFPEEKKVVGSDLPF